MAHLRLNTASLLFSCFFAPSGFLAFPASALTVGSASGCNDPPFDSWAVAGK